MKRYLPFAVLLVSLGFFSTSLYRVGEAYNNVCRSRLDCDSLEPWIATLAIASCVAAAALAVVTSFAVGVSKAGNLDS